MITYKTDNYKIFLTVFVLGIFLLPQEALAQGINTSIFEDLRYFLEDIQTLAPIIGIVSIILMGIGLVFGGSFNQAFQLGIGGLVGAILIKFAPYLANLVLGS